MDTKTKTTTKTTNWYLVVITVDTYGNTEKENKSVYGPYKRRWFAKLMGFIFWSSCFRYERNRSLIKVPS